MLRRNGVMNALKNRTRTLAARTLLLAGAVGASCLLAGCAAKQTALRNGAKAYDRGDVATARANWQPLAEKGDARAQYMLGVTFAEGNGVQPDAVQAAHWLRLAADHGYAAAQNHLGQLY